MSSMDTNHGIHEYDHGDCVIPSLHCESFHSADHNGSCNRNRNVVGTYNNDDYHHYPTATEDDDPLLRVEGRLSKRQRAYANLAVLCSSGSMNGGSTHSESNVPVKQHSMCGVSDDVVNDSDDDDDGWGYYVDSI